MDAKHSNMSAFIFAVKIMIGMVVKMDGRVVYSVVVPLYNEEPVIEESYRRLRDVMDQTKENVEFIFVNDGSRDATRDKAVNICKMDDRVKLINFSRNFGHQAAITAGMDAAEGEAVIVIDADLQDPPEVILRMIDRWKGGCDVVYGRRTEREGETFFKKFTAGVYYRMLRSMTSIDVPVDTGDFRLIDRKVCDALKSLPERNRYVRGLVSWVGYSQIGVKYVRKERFAGESKYPLKKMVKLAFDGITSLSNKPLMFPGYLGCALSAAGMISLIGFIISDIINRTGILNTGLLLSVMLVMFGLLFCTIGIMGQYIGRILDESRQRPSYIIDSIVNYRKGENKNGIDK